jgi:signal transduction histidine kinase
VLAGIRAIDRGQTDSFEFTYAGVDEWAGRKLNFRIHRTHFQGRVIATLARQDVTDSFEVDRLRRELAAAVVDSESKARERLTRELHDSTGQLLTSIGLLLATAEQKSTLPECTPIFEEMRSLLAEATREVRSMSYLSQKPDLAEIEIVESLDSLAKGFSSRSKLKISFDVLGRRTELIPATKIVVYRIAQESLSNIHRHARARRAQLSLVFKRSAVHLVIADDGVGISNDTLAGKGKSGVGLVGMRSRLADIGGRLSIRRLRKGTAIVATIPVDVHSS